MRDGTGEGKKPLFLCVFMFCGDGPWPAHMAATCGTSVVELRGEKVSQRASEGAREVRNDLFDCSWNVFLCFIDGLMFWKIQGTTVVIFARLLCILFLVVLKRTVRRRGLKTGY